MRKVSPGETILPRMTAQWFNHTIRPVTKPLTSPQKITRDKDILACSYTGSEVSQYDPVALLTTVNKIGTTSDARTEKNWVIAQKALGTDDSGVCVINGITWANVSIVQPYHEYVTIVDDILVSSCYGKAKLLVANDGTPSLISLGVGFPKTGLAKITTGIPAGNATTPGSGTGVLVEINAAGDYVETAIPLTILNTQLLATEVGIVHFKEWSGRLIVDVSPCEV